MPSSGSRPSPCRQHVDAVALTDAGRFIAEIERHKLEPVARLGGRREVASVDIGAEIKPVITSRVKEAQPRAPLAHRLCSKFR
jgi:hypothetical protein